MSFGAADAQSIKGRYRVLDHTADTGIETEAESLEELFAVSACAMFALMIDLADVRPVHKAEISLRADSLEELFVTWLNELVFRSEVSGMFFSKFEVASVDDGSLRATAWGEPYDEDRHTIDHTIKAATYYELQVSQSSGGWSVSVIFDV